MSPGAETLYGFGFRGFFLKLSAQTAQADHISTLLFCHHLRERHENFEPDLGVCIDQTHQVRLEKSDERDEFCRSHPAGPW